MLELLIEIIVGLIGANIKLGNPNIEEIFADSTTINETMLVVGTVVQVKPAVSYVNGKRIEKGIVHLYKTDYSDLLYRDSVEYPEQLYPIGSKVHIRISKNTSNKNVIN